MITWVAHGAFHAIGKGYLAIGYPVALKRVQRRPHQLREEKQDRQVTVDVADHGFGNGTAGVAFVMGKRAALLANAKVICANNGNSRCFKSAKEYGSLL